LRTLLILTFPFIFAKVRLMPYHSNEMLFHSLARQWARNSRRRL